MKNLKTFKEFVNESYNLNEAREWTDWDTSEIVRKYIKDVKNDKSLGADDLAGFMDQYANQKIEESPEKWYVEDIIQELIKKGFKNMKIEDFITGWEQTGGMLSWDMNESSIFENFQEGDFIRWSNPKNQYGVQALYGVVTKDRGQKVDITIIGSGSNDTDQPQYGPNRTPWKKYSPKEIEEIIRTTTPGEGYEKKYLSAWEGLMESKRINESDLLSKLGNNVEHETVASMMNQDEEVSNEILTAMKKLGCKAENCIVVGEYHTNDFNKVLRMVKSSGAKFIEIEDDNGSAIVFSAQ